MIRKIAVLQARPMAGSLFIMPVLFARVLDLPFPTEEDTYALAREGGFKVTKAEITVKDGDSIEEAIERSFEGTLYDHPIVVDVATGDTYVFRTKGEQYVAREGNLTKAFGCTLDGDEDEIHKIRFRTKTPGMLAAALCAGMPELRMDQATAFIVNDQRIEMKKEALVAILLAAIGLSARRHNDLNAGNIDHRTGPTLTSDIIQRFSAS